MWRNITPIKESELAEFEQKFHFQIDNTFKEFLMEHNNGIPSDAVIPTTERSRVIRKIYDFRATGDAWATNTRLKKILGNKVIVFGEDLNRNFLCLCRDRKYQRITVWTHISNQMEECIMELPALIRSIN